MSRPARLPLKLRLGEWTASWGLRVEFAVGFDGLKSQFRTIVQRPEASEWASLGLEI